MSQSQLSSHKIRLDELLLSLKAAEDELSRERDKRERTEAKCEEYRDKARVIAREAEENRRRTEERVVMMAS
jgi:hypothetical protein